MCGCLRGVSSLSSHHPHPDRRWPAVPHLGDLTFKNGVIAAAFIWFGFVITTLAVNNIFGMRKHVLILIDGAHWLGALLLMGAIIGAWGL